MTDSRTDGGSQGSKPILPPPPPDLVEETLPRPMKPRGSADRATDRSAERPAGGSAASGASSPARATPGTPKRAAAPRTRKARLRLVQLDAWSVMKTAFLLSIAIGIVTVVAVGIIWSVLSAAGVWNSINDVVQQSVGTENGDPFEIQDYLSTSRIMGFTMIVAVLDVVLITAIATLGAFLYNLSATLLGGIEVTLAEDN